MSITGRSVCYRGHAQNLSAFAHAKKCLLAPFVILAFFLFLCSANAQETVADQDAFNNPIPALGASDTTYKLDSGDIIRVNVFNNPDLSGEFQLDGEAQFVMPLIGRIDAKGLTSAELEIQLVNRLKPDYLVNPRIFVQVLNYRPYYLIGEAAGTGPYPYVAGMTYLTAIAKSGGFTYRAKKNYVYVIRADDPEQKEIKLSVDEIVQPGDIIRVAERMF